ncbi:Hin recombinase [Klebsiella pneumoniae]|nr:Hin recombinase [Klebsiella pneumoniae]NOL79958.1 Hin recombinase [Klebsiella pneumoniae]NOL85529.1 Hin recombinase [Klebsiella pneumoniae]NOM01163.1 Hin recombinase [Klebsiella pneumoniae]NOM12950.1 Hin recombinase [Klebsiella pneumoniae]
MNKTKGCLIANFATVPTRAGLAAAREQGRVGGRRRVMTEEVVERCRRMLENGATRQQVADVIGVDVKTIYKYLPAT